MVAHMKFFIFFALFLNILGGYEHKLSITAIFNNEAPYFKEWIEFYLKMGADHFYLYNNNSTDNYKEALEPYIKLGLVDLIEWPSSAKNNEFLNHCFETQTSAYTNAINRARTRSKWMAFVDLDEFFFAVQEKTLLECLETRFPNYPGVCVNWVNYGTSNVAKIAPDEHIWDKLVYRCPDNHPRNKYYKSIVQPFYVKSCTNPHCVNYFPPLHHVDTHGDVFGVDIPTIHLDIMRINHYWCRDEDYLYNVKIPRYGRWGFGPEYILLIANDLNQVFDPLLSEKMAE
jgi:hypothetical protein